MTLARFPHVALVAVATMLAALPAAGQAPAADSAAPVCEVSMPAQCSREPGASAGAMLVQKLTAATTDDCFKRAREAVATCASASAAKADVLARFRSGAVETKSRVDGPPARKGGGPTVQLPIVYGKDFEAEFDQFGYNPRFAPGPASFDESGRLRVRSGPFVQTQSADGTWSSQDLAAAAKQAIEKLPGVSLFQWVTSHRSGYSDQSIYSDSRGRLYTLVQGSPSRLGPSKALSYRPYVLYSSDGGKTWEAVALDVPDDRPTWRATIEHNDGNTDRSRPPPVLVFDQNERPEKRSAALYLATMKWAGDRIVANPLVSISDKSLLVESHSGGANSLISTADRIYVVYPGAQSLPGKRGTPAFMVTFDPEKGAVESESVLGTSGAADKVDNHNIPGICLSPGRRVHVLLPGHQEDLYLMSGKLEGTKIEWGAPRQLGETSTKAGGYTYGSLNCDGAGNIYIATRWAGEKFRHQLVLLQRDAQGKWLSSDGKKHLVMVDPGRPFYGAWRQKAAQDRDGGLYVFYTYYANYLTPPELAAMKRRFPFENWDIAKEVTPAQCISGAVRRCWMHPLPEVTDVLIKRARVGSPWQLVE